MQLGPNQSFKNIRLSPFRDFNLKYPRPIRDFSHHRSSLTHPPGYPEIGCLQFAPLCRCLLDKLRQSNIHTISKDTMHNADTKERNITLGRIMHDMKMIYCTWTYNMNFEEYIALGRTMWFLGIHCTRTYNVKFEEYTALGRTVRFLNLLYSDV